MSFKIPSQRDIEEGYRREFLRSLPGAASQTKPLVKFRRLPHGEGLPLPAYATPGAAGMDICAAEDARIEGLTSVLMPTGFAMELPPGFEAQIRPRSSLARQGLIIPNAPGTIDEDYRGEIKVLLRNLTLDGLCFSRGDRIAQLVIAPVARATAIEVEELSETERGENGFGSTGK